MSDSSFISDVADDAELAGLSECLKIRGGDASCKLVGIIYPLSLFEMWLTDLQKFGGPWPPPPVSDSPGLALSERISLSMHHPFFLKKSKYGLTVKEFSQQSRKPREFKMP